MSDLILDFDESILLSSDNAVWESRNNQNLIEFALTNQKLHCVYKKSNGFLKRASIEDSRLSLSDIKTVNGHSLIQQVRHDGSVCLEIQCIQGTEYFTFLDSPKKVIPQWIEAINNVLGTTPFISPQKKGFFSWVFSDSPQQQTPIYQQPAPHTAAQNAPVSPPPSTPPAQPDPAPASKQYRYCVNCGEKVPTTSRFCPSCGFNFAEYYGEANDQPPEVPIAEPKSPPPQPQRQQEYVGKVYKCPNCGNVINQSDAVCSSCGYHLSGKEALGSVKDFQDKLLAIEMGRPKKKAVRLNLPDTLDSADKQIISLIKTYPIPNSIDDIVEFMLLAVGSIDIGKTKKSIFNSDSFSGVSREREIGRAWVGKMEQIYNKAALYFPNEPEFVRVKELYDDMKKKLNMD